MISVSVPYGQQIRCSHPARPWQRIDVVRDRDQRQPMGWGNTKPSASIKRHEHISRLSHADFSVTNLNAHGDDRTNHLVTERVCADREINLVARPTPPSPEQLFDRGSAWMLAAERSEVTDAYEWFKAGVHRLDVKESGDVPYRRCSQGVVYVSVANLIPIRTTGRRESCMKVVRDNAQVPRRDLRTQLTVERTQHPGGVEFIAGERHDLLPGVHTFVGAASNIGCSAPCMRFEGLLQIPLNGSDVRLYGVTEEFRSVVGKIQPVRRHS